MTRATITMRYGLVHAFLLSTWAAFSAQTTLFATASVVINEVAFKGSGDSICGGEDWIELYNTNDGEAVSLTNYVLHDDKGAADEDAKSFQGVTMAPGEFLLLCRDVDFAFGIGGDDTVTLLNEVGVILDSVILPDKGADDGSETYALFEDGEYKYTATPTPGETNIYLKPVSLEEKLRTLNEEGNDFFLVNGTQIFSKVVDIHISVPLESLSMIEEHPAWEEWVPFNYISIFNIEDTEDTGSGEGAPAGAPAVVRDASAISSGGKIRVKGQSTNTVTACIGQKNVPFNIELDAPFLGMENFYLRNHFADASFMRDHASHTMLKAFGLPYLRTRPVRLFLNGEYTGFYTLMEAPSEGYVMQRSFGVFDPAKTGLFKAKTGIGDCPYSESRLTATPPLDTEAEEYYFERGDHRQDTPIIPGDYTQCMTHFYEELAKDQIAMAQGYIEHDQKCGLAMVEIGRVDRDYGPKSLEEPMIDFLDKSFFNESAADLTDSVDIDQWLRNLATYTILLNVDSPIGIINNWYIATTDGGAGDWKIVQYDHNNIMTQTGAELCSDSCAPRMVTWPILRPTCRSVEENFIVGRLLNSEENVQKYLDYIQEYVNILNTENVLETLYAYGNDIKEYVQDDPFMTSPSDFGSIKMGQYESIEAYEEAELGRNLEDYNMLTSPLLKTLAVRLQQVQDQLDAIADGSLPLDDVYEKGTVCPDWRDSNSEDFIAGSTMAESCAVPFCAEAAVCYGTEACSADGEFLVEDCEMVSAFCDNCFPFSLCGTGEKDPSGILVESETCGAECAAAAPCFDHKSGICAFDGEILTVECQAALSCKSCFPNSRCGELKIPEIFPGDTPPGDGDESSLFVQSDDCGPELAMCAEAGPCFDHNESCAKDGTNPLPECQFVLIPCKMCFPNSRCGAAEPEEYQGSDEDSSTFVASTECGPELALCGDAGPCFDHSIACAEDGSMLFEECNAAIPFCRPCFPFSRCGSGEGSEMAEDDGSVHESALFVEGEACGPELALCKEGGPCFDHTYGCREDGSIDMTLPGLETCGLALDFCTPCFPNSRCSGGEAVAAEEEQDTQETVELPNGETSSSEAMSGAGSPRATTIGPWILALLAVGLSWCS